VSAQELAAVSYGELGRMRPLALGRAPAFAAEDGVGLCVINAAP
jgi:hypothetical protein